MEKPKENDLQVKLNKRKLRNRLILVGILLGIAALVAFFIIKSKNDKELVFETKTVTKGNLISTVSTTGTLSPVSTVDVGSQVSGTIEVVYVDFNERVKKGQILVHIDPSIYRSKLDVAKAQLRSARADLLSAQAELDKANIAIIKARADVFSSQAKVDGERAALIRVRSQLISSRADVRKTKAQMDNDLAEYNRAKELFRRNLISASEKEKYYTTYLVSQASYESSQAGVKVALANITAANSNLKAALANLNASRTTENTARANARSTAARITSNLAAIQQAQGRVDEAQVNIDYCTIRSPIDGVVINRKIEPGQTVAASFQTPVLLQLAENLHKMEVKAAVDEADIGRVKNRQKVKFTVDAYPEENFKGTIEQVRSSPNTDSTDNVVTYDVIILTDNDDLKLKPGMTANIDITVREKKNVLLVSNAAMRFRPSRYPDFPYPEDDKKNLDKSKENKDKKAVSKDSSGKKARSGKGKKKEKEKNGDKFVKVWVLVKGQPSPVEFETGITDNENTEIVSGSLKEGAKVIVDAMTRKEKKTKEKKNNNNRRPQRVRF